MGIEATPFTHSTNTIRKECVCVISDYIKLCYAKLNGIDSGRSFKVGDKNGDLGAVSQLSPGAGWGLGSFALRSCRHFVKMCYFITILRMTAKFAFIAYKYEMEEK